MELQTAAVAHRTSELRRLARQLRWERRTPHGGRRSRIAVVRVAIGRRLVAIGSALLEGAGSAASVATR